MSNIKIEYVDNDYKGEFKSWGVFATVDYKDIINEELSEDEVKSLLEDEIKKPWMKFLAILQAEGVRNLKMKEEDITRSRDCIMIPNGSFPLIVNTQLTQERYYYMLESNINCDYTGSLEVEVRPE